MSDIVISKLKKYLFLISLVLLLVIGAHMIFVYLYEDAKEVPVKGWVVSEWIIWEFPHLNPLILSTDHNKYINRLLYRSLLNYDIEEGKISNDLASCDTSNLLYVECYLENNIAWSNGEPITAEDIISTFNLFKKSEVNPVMSSLLAETEIEEKDGTIIFSNEKKDISFLNVFFQPILPENVINNLTTDEMKSSFSPLDSVYSGRYVIGSVDQDETVGITKISLERNTNYFQNNMFIDTLILKLFKDENHFLKHKNSVNIFNDKQNILWESIPRLEPFEYILPQFVSVFLNSDTIESETMRNYLLRNINRTELIASLWIDAVQEIKNPFLTETEIDVAKTSDLGFTLWKLWYKSKKELLSVAEENQKEKEAEAAKKQAKTISAEANPKPITQKVEQESLSIITNPTNDKYNFITEDNVLLKWKVDDDQITAVYINDYKLNWFSQWDDVFYYRLIKWYDSIVEGKNEYKIYFEKDWERELIEEIVYFYYTDSEKLEDEKQKFFWWETIASAPSSTISSGTGSTIDSEELDRVRALDNRFYYQDDLTPYSINLLFINSDKNISDTVNFIKESIENAGIKINIIESSVASLTNDLRKEDAPYDMVVIWVNLGYLDFNMFPYLHSSQAESGYNFSNIKNLSLDILLEEMKWNNLSNTKILELEEKIWEILKEEQILKTLYSPKLKLLVDKNIENYSLASYMPDDIYRLNPLINSYISKKKTIDKENKSSPGFVRFLFTSLFN